MGVSTWPARGSIHGSSNHGMHLQMKSFRGNFPRRIIFLVFSVMEASGIYGDVITRISGISLRAKFHSRSLISTCLIERGADESASGVLSMQSTSESSGFLPEGGFDLPNRPHRGLFSFL